MSNAESIHWHLARLKPKTPSGVPLTLDGSLMLPQHGIPRVKSIHRHLETHLHGAVKSVDTNITDRVRTKDDGVYCVACEITTVSGLEAVLSFIVNRQGLATNMEMSVITDVPFFLDATQTLECGRILAAFCTLFLAKPVPGARTLDLARRPDICLVPSFLERHPRTCESLRYAVQDAGLALGRFTNRVGVVLLSSGREVVTSNKQSLAVMIDAMCSGW